MRQWLALVVSGCLVSACGGGGSGSLSVPQLATRLVSMECAARVRCNQMPSQEACEQSVHLDTGQTEADIAAGRVRYDGAAAAQCLDGIAEIGCSLSDNLVRTSPEVCDRVSQGTVAEGGACFSSSSCVSERCEIAACDPSVTCCAGKCGSPYVRAAIGASCGTTVAANCADNAFCKFAGASGTCVALVGAGQPCAGFNQCAAGLWCYAKVAGGPMTCARLPARGEACAASTPCDSSADVCGPGSTCVARVAPGGACEVDDDCYQYARCDAAAKKCVTRAARGAACAVDDDCLDGLVCPAGTCAARSAEPVCP